MTASLLNKINKDFTGDPAILSGQSKTYEISGVFVADVIVEVSNSRDANSWFTIAIQANPGVIIDNEPWLYTRLRVVNYVSGVVNAILHVPMGESVTLPYKPATAVTALITPATPFAPTSLIFSGGDYEVNWGDGIFTRYTNGLTATATPTGNITARAIQGEVIQRVEFTSDTITNVSITGGENLLDAGSIFRNLSKLLTVDIDSTKNITDFNRVFENCTSLFSIPTVMDIGSGTDMDLMFFNCGALSVYPDVLDMSKSKTSNSMFRNSGVVKLPDILDISSSLDTNSMFRDTMILETPKILDLASCLDANFMFFDCLNLLKVSTLNNMGGILKAQALFRNCISLVTAPLIMDVSGITVGLDMFRNCGALKSLPSLLNFIVCTNMSGTFRDMSSAVDLSQTTVILGVPNVMSLLFFNDSLLTKLPTINYNLSTNLDDVFSGCQSLASISPIDTSAALTMGRFVKDCTSLVCMSSLDTTAATDKGSMFSNTPLLVAPNSAERTDLTDINGAIYTNANPCP